MQATAHPHEPRALEHFRRGSEHASAGNLQSAADEFHRSLQHEPHHLAAEYLGECLLRLKRYSEAVIYFAASTYLDPEGGGHCQTRLAEGLALAGRNLEAVQAARGALNRNPSDAAARAVLERISSIVLTPEDTRF